MEMLAEGDDAMEADLVNPATVFCIRLNQPRSNLMHKMSVPELCRNFSVVAWYGKLNAIACASETCARIPSSSANPPLLLSTGFTGCQFPWKSNCLDSALSDKPFFLNLLTIYDYSAFSFF